MTDAVMTAAAVFELGSEASTVFNSALLFETRKNSGRDPVELLAEQLRRGKREST
jgi:hypothetical protein